MKVVNAETDYLRRARHVRENVKEIATVNQISPNSLAGETINYVLKLLNQHIEEIECLRSF